MDGKPRWVRVRMAEATLENAPPSAGVPWYCRRMQRVSLRRALWALGLILAVAPGCGDDGVVSSESEPGSTDVTGAPTSSGATESGVMTDVTSQLPTTSDGTSEGEETSDPTSRPGETTTTETPDPTTTTGEPNVPPVAQPDKYVAKAKQPLNVQAATGLLANDKDDNEDVLEVVSADPLTVGGAQVTAQKDGSFTYLPPADLWGDDSFAYKIWDGHDGFSMSLARVFVTPTSIPLWAVVEGKGGFVIDGEAAGDASGQAVHHIGDVNGDGLADVAVGARSTAGGSGKVYVVFGKTTSGKVTLSKLIDEGAGFVIYGSDGEGAGASVSAAGDVNGDGLPDLILGAPNGASFGNSSGSAYVVFGKNTTSSVQLEAVALGTGGFAIHGAKTNDFAGTSVRGAGDVNGDGLADVVVGAFGSDPHGALSGETFVVFGRAAGKPTNLVEVSQGLGGGFAIRGEAATDFSGSAVAGAGDVNGDGLADVIIGAYGSDVQGDTSGRAYVVFGKTSVTPVDLSAVAMGQGGFAIDGEKASDQAGGAVSGAGDMNGDGLADVIVASARIDAVGEDSGRAYVVWGKKDGQTVKLSSLAQGVGGFLINGHQVRDYAGFAVDAAGDVNGDGLDDILVGAYGANPAGDVSGRTYIVYGRTQSTPMSLGDVLYGEGGFTLDGEAKGDYSGFALGAAGDVNGDGLADVIDGAFGSDTQGKDSGRSYVVFGGDYSVIARSVGGAGPDNLAGTPEAEVFIGGRGDDTISGLGGADVIYTGQGDDEIRVEDVAFRRIHAGTGEDTLVLSGDALVLDLTQRPDGDLADIEIIDLGLGDNTLVLQRRDLLALAQSTHVLTVIGDAGTAEVDLGGGGFMNMGTVDGFKVYSDGITTLRIAVGLMANVTL